MSENSIPCNLDSMPHNPPYPLPEGWRWVRLGEVCAINPSRPKDFTRSPNAPTTFVPMAAVDEKTGTIYTPLVVPYSKVSKGYTYFEEKDVLFAKITPCMQNGKHVIARDLIDGIGFGTTEFHVLRSNGMVLPEWIHCFIRQPYFLQEATAYFTGAVGQQRIPEDFLIKYVIPLPPLPEQKRIATKLQGLMQEVERACRACERQLEAVQSLPAAYLREIFESEEAKKWERKRLGEVCEIDSNQILPSTTLAKQLTYIGLEHIENGTGKIIGTINNKECKLIQSITFRFDSSYVLYGKLRPYLNKVVTPDFEGRCTTELLPLLPTNECDRYYLAWLLRRKETVEEAMKQKTGTRMPRANMDELFKMLVPLPPLPEQKRLASKIQDFMQEIERLQYAIRNQQSALEVLPQAILRKALRGEL